MGKKPCVCFARFVFLTFCGRLAPHDSNSYPNHSHVTRNTWPLTKPFCARSSWASLYKRPIPSLLKAPGLLHCNAPPCLFYHIKPIWVLTKDEIGPLWGQVGAFPPFQMWEGQPKACLSKRPPKLERENIPQNEVFEKTFE